MTARSRKPKRSAPAADAVRKPEPTAPPSPSWTDLARRGLPLIGAIAALIAAVTRGLGLCLLILAASLLIMAISSLWSSLQIAVGDVPLTSAPLDDMPAPGAEHEQKRALLRVLKDLDHEHALGKISDDDYLELKERYRQQARALLQKIDQDTQPYRARAEAIVNEYLATASKSPAQALPASKCPKCKTVNDADAAFCKRCATKLSETTRES